MNRSTSGVRNCTRLLCLHVERTLLPLNLPEVDLLRCNAAGSPAGCPPSVGVLAAGGEVGPSSFPVLLPKLALTLELDSFTQSSSHSFAANFLNQN